MCSEWTTKCLVVTCFPFHYPTKGKPSSSSSSSPWPHRSNLNHVTRLTTVIFIYNYYYFQFHLVFDKYKLNITADRCPIHCTFNNIQCNLLCHFYTKCCCVNVYFTFARRYVIQMLQMYKTVRKHAIKTDI